MQRELQEVALSSRHLDPEPPRTTTSRPPCNHGLREPKDPLGWLGYSLNGKQPWGWVPRQQGESISPKGPGDKKAELLVLSGSPLLRVTQKASVC